MYRSGIDPTKEVGDEEIKFTKVNFTSDENKLKGACFIIAVLTPVNQYHTPDLFPMENESGLRCGKDFKYATIFGYYVADPERFGIEEFDQYGNVISKEEKPECPKSNYCITELYFYPSGILEMAKRVTPSARNEMEITDLNRLYLKEKWITKEQLIESADWYGKSPYDAHLMRVAEERIIY